MEETKTTAHITFDMVIAGSFIVIALTALIIGRSLWSVFSSQEAASHKMKDYVNYAAFDGTEVSGQDILNLLISLEEDDPNVFVAIYTKDKYMMNSSGGTSHYGAKWTYFMPVASNPTEASSLEWVVRFTGVYVEPSTMNLLTTVHGITNLANLTTSNIIAGSMYAAQFQGSNTYTDKVNYFTSPAMYGGYKEHTGDTVWQPGYSSYFSLLVYDSDSSTDPVGYVFIQEVN